MTIKCDNKEGRIMGPGCEYSSRPVMVRMAIAYHANPFDKSGATFDTLNLCGDCAERISKDAEGHGYKVSKKAI